MRGAGQIRSRKFYRARRRHPILERFTKGLFGIVVLWWLWQTIYSYHAKVSFISKIKEKFWFEVKGRILVYLMAVFFIWPVASITMATLSALFVPYYRTSLGQAILLSLGGMAIMAPDLGIRHNRSVS
jgi:hypothetical protein